MTDTNGDLHSETSPGMVVAQEARRPSLGAAIAITAAAGWTLAVGAAAVWRHQHFLSHRYDLGNMVQAIWATTQGRVLEMTDGATGDQVVRLAAHVDPLLLVFVPLWLVFPTPEALIIGQAVVLASGVYPVFRLAQKHIDVPFSGALFSCWYLLLPPVTWTALNDVHPVAFAIPLLLYCVWFLDAGRMGKFAITAVLALMTGELVGLAIAGLGIWYWLRSRRGAGLVIAAIGCTWTAACLIAVIPTFQGDQSSRYYALFEHVGGSPTGLLGKLVRDPLVVVAAVTTSADWSYLLWLLLPTAFLALGSPLILLAAAPQFSVNVLADFWPATQPMYQYTAPILAPLIAATIFAVARLPVRLRFLGALLPLTAAILCLAWNPPHPGANAYLFAQTESSARRAAMRDAVALVPSAAAVTATNRLGAHLSARRVLHDFHPRAEARWAVIDTQDAFLFGPRVDRFGWDAEKLSRLVRAMDRHPDWSLIFEEEGVRVYRR